ncbi:DUF1707 domain-containing protein [Spirillospora sp. NPDC048832]
MSVEQHPALRASDRDRDEMLVRLHTAFAEGRLDEPELDERIDRVLAARTHADLGAVAADLPSGRSAPTCPGAAPAGRFQLAYKTSVTRAGRWRLPERFTTVVYKGCGTLDLQAAELPGRTAVLRVLAYKSTVEIIVPPGIRVEAEGAGISTEVHGDPVHGDPLHGAPVVHVRGYAYKGAIRVKGLIRRL